MGTFMLLASLCFLCFMAGVAIALLAVHLALEDYKIQRLTKPE